MITEVQNIIGQMRELGMQFRELTEKVRVIEGNDTNERFGVELAGALSRIEKVRLGSLCKYTLLCKYFNK